MSGRYLLSKGGSAAYREDVVSAIEMPTMRPVVVIDPEDREQARRLIGAVHDYYPITRDTPPSKQNVDAMQAALRSLIAPPKPPEPTGLGAVVEDNKGSRWIRIWGKGIGCAWVGCPSDDAADERQPYSSIAAVKVLNQGVTS